MEPLLLSRTQLSLSGKLLKTLEVLPNPKIAIVVCENFYVDNCLCSVSSVDEGRRLVYQFPNLLQMGGFHLIKWIANNIRVLDSISEERSSSLQRLNFEDDSLERILRMC